MTTTPVATIIQDAYRESNLIAIVDSPTVDEQNEALRLLQRLISLTYNADAGEKLTDFPIGRNNIARPAGWPYYQDQPTNDWFVPLNARIVCNIDSPQNIYLAPTPEDGTLFSYIDTSNNFATNPITIYGNGRLIEGQTSVIKNTNGDTAEYIYLADEGGWQKLSPITLVGNMPFPQDFDDVFVISLAMRLNPRNDVNMSPETIQAYKTALNRFKARYAQVIPTPAELGLILTPGMRRIRGAFDVNAATAAFLAGNPLIYRGWF